MKITARALNRATLARQLLLRREPLDAAAAVKRVVALQAQHPASPYIALWNRLAGFDPAGLDAAIASRAVVRATLMRVTIHAVHAADYPAFRAAMEPILRASRLGDRRFTASGLTAADADTLIPELLDFARQHRTSAECLAWLEQRLGRPVELTAWRMLRQYAPLWHAPAEEPWLFGTKRSYVAPRTRPVLADPDVSARALRTLIRRYLEGFGPASVADIARFTMIQRSRVTAAVRALTGELEQLEGPDGKAMYDIPGASRPDEDTPAPPRLMAMWDSILLAYADHGRVFPAGYRAHVTRVNGDVLPTLLVDGHVAGVWRPAREGARGAIEAAAFHPLPAGTWEGLAAEAGALTALLADREPDVYAATTTGGPNCPAPTSGYCPD
jgi:winged helix DNA-binding protein